jgi:pseudouridine-5'-phosphate glycosidase
MSAVNLRLSPRIRRALADGRPVVALESTVITHGLPRPDNLELAEDLESEVRSLGAEPATIGVLHGTLVVGLEPVEVRALDAAAADKATHWNLAAIMTRGGDAGTTVATTLLAAAAAGIEVFATGGIGGVHQAPFDESADLHALARHAVVTVSAGPKSILDVPATIERLETLGVPVIGYGTPWVAGFHAATADVAAAARADTPQQVAEIFRMHRSLGLPGGILVTKPVSEGMDPADLAELLAAAAQDAADAGLRGKDTTPFLLARLAERSDGGTVEVNTRLLRENARLAAQVARALADVAIPSGALP